MSGIGSSYIDTTAWYQIVSYLMLYDQHPLEIH